MRAPAVTTPLTPSEDLDHRSPAALSAYIQRGARCEDGRDGRSVCEVSIVAPSKGRRARPPPIVGVLRSEAAKDAVGSILTAIDGVMKKDFSNAFCAVRPPGHHAEKQKAMGFCVYNNVAVGAYYLLEKYKLKKVAIIDFDVHHGNGTQNIFYDNEKVLYISSHQYPYYPGSGAANEKGNKDNILNVPLNAGTQPHEFLNAYDSIFKKLKEFKPEFILLSAGFDAHKNDPLAQINLESKDYYTLTNRILTLAKKLCAGKVVSILEGGYNLNALKESVDYHVKSLMEN